MTSPPDRPVCGNTIGDWLIVGDFGDGLSGSVYRVRHLRRPGLSGVLKLHRVWENGVSEKSFLAERTLAEQPPLPERMAKWLVSDSWQGHPYFVTTYLDPTPKGLSDREWMTYAFALIDLFAELNGNRLIYHRDVKPRNLRSRNGLPMLIDLGLAIPRDDDALYPLEHVGSRDFIAPEILRGERYDVRSEIYSTARTLLAILPTSVKRTLSPSLFHASEQNREQRTPSWQVFRREAEADWQAHLRNRKTRLAILSAGGAAAAIFFGALAYYHYDARQIQDKSDEHYRAQSLAQHGLDAYNNHQMDKAVFYLKQAADSGCCTNSHAIGTLAYIYFRGNGVRDNDKLCIKYATMAAKLGDGQANALLRKLGGSLINVTSKAASR